jgi:hypothetical protein
MSPSLSSRFMSWIAMNVGTSDPATLSEGPRVMTNIVDCAADEVGIGAALEVVFYDTAAGGAVPRFRLTRGK